MDTTHPDLFALLKKDDKAKVKPSINPKNQQTLLDMSSKYSYAVEIPKSKSSNESAKDKEILTSETVLEKVKRLLHLFFNSCNIAIRQSRNVHLKDLLQELVMHGSLLKNVSNKIFFTRYSYKKEEKKMFSNIVTNVMESVKRSRDFYEYATGSKGIPFLNVSHDGWDSKRHDILGACIHYVCPETWCQISVPIGLKRINRR
ncbi:MAG: hypothetical protein MUF12_09740 [Sediminibacterium sp.]|nr:hypothetical protein [Sediminibacterium sp.]